MPTIAKLPCKHIGRKTLTCHGVMYIWIMFVSFYEHTTIRVPPKLLLLQIFPLFFTFYMAKWFNLLMWMRCASPIAHSNFQASIQFLVEYSIVYGKIVVLHMSLCKASVVYNKAQVHLTLQSRNFRNWLGSFHSVTTVSFRWAFEQNTLSWIYFSCRNSLAPS
jgi:hypothetical protein